MKGRKGTAVIVGLLVLTMVVAVLPGCTAADMQKEGIGKSQSDEKMTRVNFFENEDYGFSLNMPESILTTLTWEEDADWTLDPDVSKDVKRIWFYYNTPFGKEDVFDLCVFNSEITPEEMAELNPMLRIIGSDSGYTYTVQYAEDPSEQLFEDAEALNEYYKFMNDWSASIAESIEYL